MYSEFAHVRSAAESALAKLYSKIVILDLQKSIFFRPAGAVQRGSVCTLSLIEPVQCVSERSPLYDLVRFTPLRSLWLASQRLGRSPVGAGRRVERRADLTILDISD